MGDILQTFLNAFSWKKNLDFDLIDVSFRGFNWQGFIDSVDGLAPNRWQAIS